MGLDKLNATHDIDFSAPIKNGPQSHGFDYSYGFCGSLDMAPYVWVENSVPTMVPTKNTVNKGGQDFWREGPTSDDFDHEQVLPHITQKAVAYIKEKAHNEKPFFLYLPLSAPHTPILPTDEFKGKSGLDNPYGDFVLMVDRTVEEISKALKEQGIEENTLLVFTSDNGCSPTADFQQLATKGHDPSYLFRGHKADIFEGGHRVPYLVSWPAKVKPGTSDRLLCTTDLFATVADIIGVTYPDSVAVDSYSYLSALNLKSKAKERASVVHHSINGSFAIRKGEWKAVFCPGSGGWSAPKPNSKAIEELPPVQLYNLKEDVAEEVNLQAQHPEMVEEFRRILSGYVQEGRSTQGAPQKNDGPQTWAQLKWMNE
jgi:arylsulfatase A-like enzyme